MLLVEDEPSIRASFTRLLERAGFRVDTARNVPEAMDALARPGEVPDVVLLDMILPDSSGQSGLDVLERLRQAPGSTNVPVLIWTGYPLSKQVLGRLHELRAELMHKPVQFNDLLPALTRLIESSHSEPRQSPS